MTNARKLPSQETSFEEECDRGCRTMRTALHGSILKRNMLHSGRSHFFLTSLSFLVSPPVDQIPMSAHG